MTSQKDLALLKSETGDTDAWLALKSIPDEAARQALSLIARESPEIAMRTLALIAGTGIGRDATKNGLEFRGALYIADREARTGERFGLHFYWTPEMGPIDSVIGIRDRVTKNIGPVEYRFRPLTAEEIEINGLETAGEKPDIAVAVEITVQRDRQAAVSAYREDLAAYKAALEAAKMRADILGRPVNEVDLPAAPTIKYKPVTGVGIVLAEEMYEGVWNTEKVQGKYGMYDRKTTKKPRSAWGDPKPFDFVNYTWHEKAETRALRAGFRRVPGALAEYEQKQVAGEGVTLDMPDAKPVSRTQLLEAIEKEAARQAATDAIEHAPDKDKILAAMREGAYGAQKEGTAPSIIDVAALTQQLRAAVAEQTKRHPGAANARQLASAWGALDQIDKPAVFAPVLAQVFGHDGELTAAECAAVYFWLKPATDSAGALTLNAEATLEARALVAGMAAEPEELPFGDPQTEETDVSTH